MKITVKVSYDEKEKTRTFTLPEEEIEYAIEPFLDDIRDDTLVMARDLAGI